jgi:hypothetical protein
VLRIVDIQTVSIAIASASVVAGVVYYALQLRLQTKSRKTDAFWRVYQSFNSKEFIEAQFKVWNLDFKDYNDFLKKYGSPFAESSVATAIGIVCNLYEGAGELLYRGLVDQESVSDIPSRMVWRKVKPIVEGARIQYNFPLLYDRFEYLCNEMKKRDEVRKREQKLQQSSVKEE